MQLVIFFYLYLVFHAYDARFDMIVNLVKFWETRPHPRFDLFQSTIPINILARVSPLEHIIGNDVKASSYEPGFT